MRTVLGTGLLGSGFVRGFRRRNETVRVWNRTLAKAQALASTGAEVFTDPAVAIRGVDIVHVVLADDEAVDLTLAAAAPLPGTRVFDHSTTSTAGVLARTAMWADRGVTYVHAPVFMGPGNAESATGLMLLSGDREIVAAAKPMLAPMTGKLLDLGERVDAAAGFKLLGNLLLMAITAGFADMLGLAKALGIAPGEVRRLLDHFNPGASLPARFERMIAAPYDQPSWELAMARKDARLVQGEVDGAGITLGVLPAIAARMDQLLAQGLGHADWTVLARDFLGANEVSNA